MDRPVRPRVRAGKNLSKTFRNLHQPSSARCPVDRERRKPASAEFVEAQVTRTLDGRPDDPAELSIFAVRKLRDMVHELREWFEEQP